MNVRAISYGILFAVPFPRTISRVFTIRNQTQAREESTGVQDFVFNYPAYMYLPYDLPCTRSSRVEIPHFLVLGMITRTFRIYCFMRWHTADRGVFSHFPSFLLS